MRSTLPTIWRSRVTRVLDITVMDMLVGTARARRDKDIFVRDTLSF
jgi:hypothetical protein